MPNNNLNHRVLTIDALSIFLQLRGLLCTQRTYPQTPQAPLSRLGHVIDQLVEADYDGERTASPKGVARGPLVVDKCVYAGAILGERGAKSAKTSLSSRRSPRV